MTAGGIGKSGGVSATLLGWLQESKVPLDQVDQNQDGQIAPEEIVGFVVKNYHENRFNDFPELQKKFDGLLELFRIVGIEPEQAEQLLLGDPVPVAKNLTAQGKQYEKKAEKPWKAPFPEARAELYGKAKTAFGLALELDPTNAEAHRGMAGCLEREGNTAEVREHRRLASLAAERENPYRRNLLNQSLPLANLDLALRSQGIPSAYLDGEQDQPHRAPDGTITDEDILWYVGSRLNETAVQLALQEAGIRPDQILPLYHDLVLKNPAPLEKDGTLPQSQVAQAKEQSEKALEKFLGQMSWVAMSNPLKRDRAILEFLYTQTPFALLPQEAQQSLLDAHGVVFTRSHPALTPERRWAYCLHLQAQEMMARGDLEGATLIYDHVVKLAPQDPALLLIAAKAYRAMGKKWQEQDAGLADEYFDKAYDCLTTLMAGYPEDWEFWMMRGELSDELNRPHSAHTAYSKAIEYAEAKGIGENHLAPIRKARQAAAELKDLMDKGTERPRNIQEDPRLLGAVGEIEGLSPYFNFAIKSLAKSDVLVTSFTKIPASKAKIMQAIQDKGDSGAVVDWVLKTRGPEALTSAEPRATDWQGPAGLLTPEDYLQFAFAHFATYRKALEASFGPLPFTAEGNLDPKTAAAAQGMLEAGQSAIRIELVGAGLVEGSPEFERAYQTALDQPQFRILRHLETLLNNQAPLQIRTAALLRLQAEEQQGNAAELERRAKAISEGVSPRGRNFLLGEAKQSSLATAQNYENIFQLTHRPEDAKAAASWYFRASDQASQAGKVQEARQLRLRGVEALQGLNTVSGKHNLIHDGEALKSMGDALAASGHGAEALQVYSYAWAAGNHSQELQASIVFCIKQQDSHIQLGDEFWNRYQTLEAKEAQGKKLSKTERLVLHRMRSGLEQVEKLNRVNFAGFQDVEMRVIGALRNQGVAALKTLADPKLKKLPDPDPLLGLATGVRRLEDCAAQIRLLQNAREALLAQQPPYVQDHIRKTGEWSYLKLFYPEDAYYPEEWDTQVLNAGVLQKGYAQLFLTDQDSARALAAAFVVFQRPQIIPDETATLQEMESSVAEAMSKVFLIDREGKEGPVDLVAGRPVLRPEFSTLIQVGTELDTPLWIGQEIEETRGDLKLYKHAMDSLQAADQDYAALLEEIQQEVAKTPPNEVRLAQLKEKQAAMEQNIDALHENAEPALRGQTGNFSADWQTYRGHASKLEFNQASDLWGMGEPESTLPFDHELAQAEESLGRVIGSLDSMDTTDPQKRLAALRTLNQGFGNLAAARGLFLKSLSFTHAAEVKDWKPPPKKSTEGMGPLAPQTQKAWHAGEQQLDDALGNKRLDFGTFTFPPSLRSSEIEAYLDGISAFMKETDPEMFRDPATKLREGIDGQIQMWEQAKSTMAKRKEDTRQIDGILKYYYGAKQAMEKGDLETANSLFRLAYDTKKKSRAAIAWEESNSREFRNTLIKEVAIITVSAVFTAGTMSGVTWALRAGRMVNLARAGVATTRLGYGMDAVSMAGYSWKGRAGFLALEGTSFFAWDKAVRYGASTQGWVENPFLRAGGESMNALDYGFGIFENIAMFGFFKKAHKIYEHAVLYRRIMANPGSRALIQDAFNVSKAEGRMMLQKLYEEEIGRMGAWGRGAYKTGGLGTEAGAMLAFGPLMIPVHMLNEAGLHGEAVSWEQMFDQATSPESAAHQMLMLGGIKIGNWVAHPAYGLVTTKGSKLARLEKQIEVHQRAGQRFLDKINFHAENRNFKYLTETEVTEARQLIKMGDRIYGPAHQAGLNLNDPATLRWMEARGSLIDLITVSEVQRPEAHLELKRTVKEKWGLDPESKNPVEKQEAERVLLILLSYASNPRVTGKVERAFLTEAELDRKVEELDIGVKLLLEAGGFNPKDPAFNKLRETFLTQFLEAGVPPERISGYAQALANKPGLAAKLPTVVETLLGQKGLDPKQRGPLTVDLLTWMVDVCRTRDPQGKNPELILQVLAEVEKFSPQIDQHLTEVAQKILGPEAREQDLAALKLILFRKALAQPDPRGPVDVILNLQAFNQHGAGNLGSRVEDLAILLGFKGPQSRAALAQWALATGQTPEALDTLIGAVIRGEVVITIAKGKQQGIGSVGLRQVPSEKQESQRQAVADRFPEFEKQGQKYEPEQFEARIREMLEARDQSGAKSSAGRPREVKQAKAPPPIPADATKRSPLQVMTGLVKEFGLYGKLDLEGRKQFDQKVAEAVQTGKVTPELAREIFATVDAALQTIKPMDRELARRELFLAILDGRLTLDQARKLSLASPRIWNGELKVGLGKKGAAEPYQLETVPANEQPQVRQANRKAQIDALAKKGLEDLPPAVQQSLGLTLSRLGIDPKSAAGRKIAAALVLQASNGNPAQVSLPLLESYGKSFELLLVMGNFRGAKARAAFVAELIARGENLESLYDYAQQMKNGEIVPVVDSKGEVSFEMVPEIPAGRRETQRSEVAERREAHYGQAEKAPVAAKDQAAAKVPEGRLPGPEPIQFQAGPVAGMSTGLWSALGKAWNFISRIRIDVHLSGGFIPSGELRLIPEAGVPQGRATAPVGAQRRGTQGRGAEPQALEPELTAIPPTHARVFRAVGGYEEIPFQLVPGEVQVVDSRQLGFVSAEPWKVEITVIESPQDRSQWVLIRPVEGTPEIWGANGFEAIPFDGKFVPWGGKIRLGNVQFALEPQGDPDVPMGWHRSRIDLNLEMGHFSTGAGHRRMLKLSEDPTQGALHEEAKQFRQDFEALFQETQDYHQAWRQNEYRRSTDPAFRKEMDERWNRITQRWAELKGTDYYQKEVGYYSVEKQINSDLSGLDLFISRIKDASVRTTRRQGKSRPTFDFARNIRALSIFATAKEAGGTAFEPGVRYDITITDPGQSRKLVKNLEKEGEAKGIRIVKKNLKKDGSGDILLEVHVKKTETVIDRGVGQQVEVERIYFVKVVIKAAELRPARQVASPAAPQADQQAARAEQRPLPGPEPRTDAYPITMSTDGRVMGVAPYSGKGELWVVQRVLGKKGERVLTLEEPNPPDERDIGRTIEIRESPDAPLPDSLTRLGSQVELMGPRQVAKRGAKGFVPPLVFVPLFGVAKMLGIEPGEAALATVIGLTAMAGGMLGIFSWGSSGKGGKAPSAGKVEGEVVPGAGGEMERLVYRKSAPADQAAAHQPKELSQVSTPGKSPSAEAELYVGGRLYADSLLVNFTMPDKFYEISTDPETPSQISILFGEPPTIIPRGLMAGEMGQPLLNLYRRDGKYYVQWTPQGKQESKVDGKYRVKLNGQEVIDLDFFHPLEVVPGKTFYLQIGNHLLMFGLPKP